MAELQPGSPEWWLDRLKRDLDKRRPDLERYEDYYSGEHKLAFASAKFRQAFGGLFEEFADDWCELVVDAVEERLNVEGFRFGDDPEGDVDAWAIWQRNMLDADSQVAHTEALINGLAYALVWVGPDGESPEITIEHPTQMIVATAAGNRRRRTAALKVWTDDDGFELATVYLPDGIYKFRSRIKTGAISSMGTGSRFQERRVEGEDWPLPNPLGVVPVVPLPNRPRLLSPGRSEIAKVIPIQDAVNKLVADMLVASEFQAFRQRWATGIEIPVDPETGEPVEPFKHAVDRLWIGQREEGSEVEPKFGEFGETDLSNFVEAIEMLVQHIASQTRTPPHYFYLRGEFPSGESIKSAEAGLVAKARRKMRHFGEAWEEVMRLAFSVMDDARSQVMAAETIWADPEFRTEGEHVDALLKLASLGVPRRQLWEDAGYSPPQIERFETMAARESLLSRAADLSRISPISPTE